MTDEPGTSGNASGPPTGPEVILVQLDAHDVEVIGLALVCLGDTLAALGPLFGPVSLHTPDCVRDTARKIDRAMRSQVPPEAIMGGGDTEAE